MVRMIVGAGMHHQRATANFGQRFQAWGEHGIRRGAVRRNVKRGQVTEVPIAPRFSVMLGPLRIEMPAGALRRYGRSVLGGRCTGGIFVYVKAMQADRQLLQVRA